MRITRARHSPASAGTDDDDLRLIFEGAPIGMALVSVDGRFLRVNASMGGIVGYAPEELLGMAFQDITHPDDLGKDLDRLRECLSGQRHGYEVEKRYLHRDGHPVWVQLNAALARDGEGTPTHFVSQVLDITDRRAAAAALEASEARFAAMVEHGSDLIAVTDQEGILIYASPAYETVLGWDPTERIGLPLQSRIHPEDLQAVEDLGVSLTTQPGASGRMQFRYAHADGSWRWVEATLTNRLEDPAVGGFVINTRDVTERVLATERLAHQASHDVLTGLPNRSLLDDRLAQATASARRHGEVLAVLFIDLDHFKTVNDTFGHQVGDQLLVSVATRLQDAARGDDTVARLGGDEFVIVASVASEADARALADRASGAFAEPFVIGDRGLAVTASLGLATMAGERGPADVLAAADRALYEAKAQGRATWVAYRPPAEEAAEAPGRYRLDAHDADEITSAEHRAQQSAAAASVAARSRAHVAQTDEAVVIYAGGTVVAASPAALRLVDADGPERVVGHSILELVTPESIEATRARRVAVTAGAWQGPAVFDLTTFDGSPLSVEVTPTPTLWDGGSATQITLRPVEDRWAEIVRIGSELIGFVRQAVIITDLQHQVVAWNDRATEVYGWTRAEVLGRPLGEVVVWSGASSDRVRAEREVRAAGHWAGAVTQLHRDGSVVAVDAVMRMIHDRDGVPIGIVSAAEPAREQEAQTEAEAVLLAELAVAVERDELVVAYQPIVDPSGRVRKVEALVRWQHPDRGLLAPSAFIPVAERSGLMGAITATVLSVACRQVAGWRRTRLPELELAVNVSARELSDPCLLQRVHAALGASGLPPTALWLEVTETALAEVEETDAIVAELHALGVRFALDDFGTGFATLAQLHRFPSQALKIDRLFVQGLTDDVSTGDAAIVRSVMALGRELGLTVIAEGVETVEQRDILVRMGCERLQGYLFARPTFVQPAPSWLPPPPLDRTHAGHLRPPVATAVS